MRPEIEFNAQEKLCVVIVDDSTFDFFFGSPDAKWIPAFVDGPQLRPVTLSHPISRCRQKRPRESSESYDSRQYS